MILPHARPFKFQNKVRISEYITDRTKKTSEMQMRKAKVESKSQEKIPHNDAWKRIQNDDHSHSRSWFGHLGPICIALCTKK